ncbi:hypothetical protein GCM10019016_104460 [Streptomyces prasinosporus]|uniref:Uncharacterized protein n=1 Tax=Streptomyces prasinosporus TaxID=68256 RepID=A0ABP6UAU3_9ACTN
MTDTVVVLVKLRGRSRSRWGAAAGAAVQAADVVPARGVFEDRGADRGSAGPRLAVGRDRFAFEGSEERLRESIVAADSDPPDGQAYAPVAGDGRDSRLVY